MADIELVVKMPEKLYNYIRKGCGIYPYRLVYEAMKNGTPLPKGHGRVMDVDKIIKKMEDHEELMKDNRALAMYETVCVETALDTFGETIIEADTESEGKE